MGCAQGLQDLLALWVDGDAAHMALGVPALKLRIIVSVPLRRGSFPSVAKNHAAAIRLERTLRDLHGVEPKGLPDQRNWIDHGKWPSPPPSLKKGAARPDTAYAFLAAEGEGLHQIAGGAGSCRDHRARTFPLHCQRRSSGAPRRAARLCPQGHRGPVPGCRYRHGGAHRSAHFGRQHGCLLLCLCACHRSGARVAAAPRAVLLRGIMAELERLSHHVNDVGAICNDASVVVLHAHCTLAARRHSADCQPVFRPPHDDGPHRAGRRRRRSFG